MRWAALFGALLCFLMLIALAASAQGFPLSASGRVQSVLTVGAAGPPVLPRTPAPEMGRAWAAATAQEPWPGLATGGRTGTSGGKVSLTFDDGPNRAVTPRVLDTLREHGLKATFFVLGRQVEKNPDLLRRIVEEGHALGNHTHSHADMAELGPAGMRRELRSTQRAVDDALGYHYPMAFMRPPYGSPYFGDPGALPAFRRVVREQELFSVVWTVDPRDYLFDGRPDLVARRVVRGDRIKRGAGDEVILLHDTEPQTADALPRIIAHYEASGVRFAGVDDLLADKYTGS